MSGESRKARNIVRELDLEPEQVLLGRARKRIASLGELERRCLARLSAHIWSTCCWPDAMGENGWKIGDFKFVVVSTGAGEIYVQFWSEPREIVSAEVSSGEWSPATLKHLGREQRQVLTSLGYVIGGEAGNFQKEVEITTSAQAEAAAREVLHILFDVFGYRGQ